ncbi:unnamed protein product, partial [Phaeothamnion confervicola]
IGSKAFINDETGILFDPVRPLGQQLREALAKGKALRPRSWAEANISAEVSVRRLERLLCEDATGRRQPWTVGLSQFYCRNFFFHYADREEASRMADAYRQLEVQCGLEIPVQP